MGLRKKLLLFIVAYALFVVTSTQAFVPNGFRMLPAETTELKTIANASFAMGYFLIAMVCVRVNARRVPLGAAWISAGVFAVAQIVFYAQNYGGLSFPFSVIAAFQIAVGISQAILFSFWAGCSTLLSSRDFRFCILAGSLFSSFAVVFINSISVPLLSVSCSASFSVVSVAVVSVLFRQTDSKSGTDNSSFLGDLGSRRKIKETLKMLSVPVICIGVLGFTYQCAFVVVGADWASGMFFAIGEAFAVSIIFLLLALPDAQVFNLLAVFRVLCPVAFISVGALYFADGMLGLILMGISSATFNLGIVLLMPLCASLGRKHNVSPSLIYCLAAGVVNSFPTFGYIIGSIPSDRATVSAYVGMAVLFILLLFAALLFDKSEGKFDVPVDSPLSLASSDGAATNATVIGRNMVASYIADEYGLTQREKEVLESILLGRDAPTIAEEFCISVNTVKTHVKRIYSKVDVHSRQDLATLVEDIEGFMRIYLDKKE